MAVARAGGAGNGEVVFNGCRVSVTQMKRVLDGGDHCTVHMCLMLPNCALNNGQGGQFEVMCL